MPYIQFTFENTNQDQSFQFDDEIDVSNNPRMVGPVNHNDTSPVCQCWAGSDGRGKIILTGSISGSLAETIDEDGYSFRF